MTKTMKGARNIHRNLRKARAKAGQETINFKPWARERYSSYPADMLSPKLRRIVRSA